MFVLTARAFLVGGSYSRCQVSVHGALLCTHSDSITNIRSVASAGLEYVVGAPFENVTAAFTLQTLSRFSPRSPPAILQFFAVIIYRIIHQCVRVSLMRKSGRDGKISWRRFAPFAAVLFSLLPFTRAQIVFSLPLNISLASTATSPSVAAPGNVNHDPFTDVVVRSTHAVALLSYLST